MIIELDSKRKIVKPCSTTHSIDTLVLLGTISTRYDGSPNLFFDTRIEKASELYHCADVKTIIVSGNYNRRGYNEARDMQLALLKKDIPAEDIIIDDESYRTYDTFRNLKKNYQLRQCLIVSQAFHNKRALYIAKSMGIKAWACNASNHGEDNFYLAQVREVLARVKTLIDLHLLSPEEKKWSSG